MWTLRWTIPAVHALEAAHAYYHELNPQAANRLAQRIVDSAAMLAQQPAIGRPGLRPGTREWVVSGTPYILVCRHMPDAVEILQVWHAAQDRTND